MASLSHSESKRLYSWWWDSNIRTKNSKWLKENLTDMDSKIKSMIKIIEEDADSFARRAEMYYKRRPELMSLVEEIYRAYRALADRYDHATGALRQAHRTMAQAFPDLNFDEDDDDDDGDDEVATMEEGSKGQDFMMPILDLQKRIKEYEMLENEISRLSEENEHLKNRMALKSQNEFEISSLKEIISKLEMEKEESSERLTNLTAEISRTQQDFDRLKDEMQSRVQVLSSAEQRCDELERTNQSLCSELERVKSRWREKDEEVEKLNISIQSEQIQRMGLEKKMKVFGKLEKELERIKDEKRKLEGQNRVSNSVIGRLEGDVKKGEERCVELERRNRDLSKELERIKQRGRECGDELERRNRDLSKEIERMRGRERECVDEVKKGGERCVELERRNEYLNLELERMKEELKLEMERMSVSLQETQLKKMKAEISQMSLEKSFAESQEKVRVLSEDRERLEIETERCVALERMNQSLSSELERIKQREREHEEKSSKKIPEMEREMEKIKGENSTLYFDLKERETELNEKRVEFERLNESKMQAEMEKIELEVEMERIKGEHANLSVGLKERETKLSEKIGKLEKISVNLQEAHLQKMQAQIAHLSIEKNLVEMQQKLNIFSLQKEKFEKEIEKLTEENIKFGEKNHSSNTRIILLQDEVIKLKDLNRKLEDQVSLHAEEMRIAKEELSRVRGDESDSEWRHFSLTDQIQTVNLNVESLKNLVTELKSGNFELNEIIKHHEEVKILQTENFKQLERVSEKNSVLETSLLVANAELEGLRNKKNELEISICTQRDERAVMSSQIETMSENIEKLVTKKILLENSLSDANAEILGLREKLEDLDEFCISLRDQNEKLQFDKRSLIAEVKNNSNTLVKLEEKYRELESNYSNLHEEKTQILNQVINLQNLLNQERNSNTETLNSLKFENLNTREELESEQKRVVIAQSEIFKLERSLNEANEKISKLNFIQKDKERLMKGIISIKESLKLDKKYDSLHSMKDEIIVQLILHEIKLLLNSIGESQDSKQKQTVEKSLVVTLLDHFGKEVAELRLERSDLKRENESKSKDLNELKNELEFILSQVSDLQDSRRSLQKEIMNLFEENSSLSNRLKEKEDSNSNLSESISQDILAVIFKTFCSEQLDSNSKLRNEMQDLKNRENEFVSCDQEISKLLGNIKNAIFNAGLFKEKVLELIITCESFEISEMVQREVLKEEIERRNSYVHELKLKLSKVEVENRSLKVDLNGEFTILGSLQDEMRALEEQTLSLARENRSRANKHKKEEKRIPPSKTSKTRLKLTKEEAATTKTLNPNLELQKLHSTIKSLQKVVRDTSLVLNEEHLDFASTLSDAKKQVKVLKLKEISDDDVARVNPKVNYEQKDIQLDLVQSSISSFSSSSRSSRGERERVRSTRQHNVRASGASENSETWGFVEGGEREIGSERKKQNVRSLMMHDIELEYPEIELVEREGDVKGKRPSTDQMSEKELGVDDQIVPFTKVGMNESYQEWRKTVLETLSNDSQRLVVLQNGLNEIKSSIDLSEGRNYNLEEIEGVKSQIREAEGSILQLIETNNKLSKKMDDFANNSDEENSSNNNNSGELITKSQRKILERAKKASEKIEKLEFELEIVQNLILKFEEENSSRNNRIGQRRSKVLLVEYLYGKKKDGTRQRKGPSCGCMRLKTKE